MPLGIYAALPPEVNVGMLLVGAGPVPMALAATGYSAIAQTMDALASGSDSQVQALMSTWRSEAATRAEQAFTRHSAWLREASGVARSAAAKAGALAQAYTMAVAASPNPVEIAANRALLTGLMAANGNGATTAAIAAVEADYMRMWVQAAGAMSAYDAQATPNMMLTESAQAPAITSGAGSSSEAQQLLSTLMSVLTPLLTGVQQAVEQARAREEETRQQELLKEAQQPLGFLGTSPGSPTLTELNGGMGSDVPVEMTYGGLGAVPVAAAGLRMPGSWPVTTPGTPGASAPVSPLPGTTGGQTGSGVGGAGAPYGAIAPRGGGRSGVPETVITPDRTREVPWLDRATVVDAGDLRDDDPAADETRRAG